MILLVNRNIAGTAKVSSSRVPGKYWLLKMTKNLMMHRIWISLNWWEHQCEDTTFILFSGFSAWTLLALFVKFYRCEYFWALLWRILLSNFVFHEYFLSTFYFSRILFEYFLFYFEYFLSTFYLDCLLRRIPRIYKFKSLYAATIVIRGILFRFLKNNFIN